MLETEIKNLTAAITALTNRLGGVGTELPAATPAAAPPAAAPPAAAPPAAAPPAAAPPAAEGALTLEVTRNRLAAVIEVEGPDRVQAAISTFGVNLLTELPAENYQAVLTAVGA